MIRWIVTDLDGTLVDRGLRMVASSREALQRFRAGGGRVVIATGRSRESAAPYYRELGLTGPAILLNGAQIGDLSTGEMLLDVRLPEPVWGAVRDLLDRLPLEAAGVAFVDGQAYRVSDSELISAYAARDRLIVKQVSGWHELPAGSVSKALVLCANEKLAAGMVRQTEPMAVSTVISEPTYVELLPSGVDKGTALRWLASRYGVPLDEVAAIGDNPNDIPMFGVAGLSAAVGDGHPETRKAASLTVAPCADGAVADLVGHITRAP